jgi:hypothetical protein
VLLALTNIKNHLRLGGTEVLVDGAFLKTDREMKKVYKIE